MKLWKVLSAAALVAGLAPYKVEKDEASGKTTYQALLWRGSTSEKDGEKHFGIDLGEGTLTQALREKAAAKEEAHLFTDELTVDFSRSEAEAADTEAAEAEIEAMAAQAEARRLRPRRRPPRRKQPRRPPRPSPRSPLSRADTTLQKRRTT